MAVTLGGVTLPPSIIWEDRKHQFPVRQTVRVTTGGSIRIMADAVTGLRPVTLVAKIDQGWLDESTYNALYTLSSNPGGIYTFNFHDKEILQVVFRHHEQKALACEPLVAGGEDGDKFIGRINLMTVE